MHKKWLAPLLGNLLEHYDSALYGFLAPFIAPLFFSHLDPMAALIMAYAIMPLSTLSKPVGAIFFGYIGDTYGTVHALRISIFGMALVTALIGCLPTQAQAGMLAPLLLALCRILQGFFTAGENAGGAIYLLEKTPSSHHNYISSLYGGAMTAGILLASMLVACICHWEINWRILFWLGAFTGVIGFILRFSDSPEEMNLRKKQSKEHIRTRLKKQFRCLWDERKALLAIALASGFSYSSYTIALVLTNSFIPLVTSYSIEQMMSLNTYLLTFDLLLMPLIGYVFARVNHEKLMIIACLLTLLLAIPLISAIPSASLAKIIFIRSCFVFLGVLFFAPYYAWSLKIVSKDNRYTILSLGYALGSQGLGTPTAALSLWLFYYFNSVIAIVLYWLLLALCTLLCLLSTARINLTAYSKPLKDLPQM